VPSYLDLDGDEAIRSEALWDHGYLQLDPHTGVTRRFTATASSAPGLEVELEADVIVERRRAVPHCVKLMVRRVDALGRASREPVTTDILRSIPIARILARAMENPFMFFKIGEGPEGRKRLELPGEAERAKLYARHVEGARQPRRGSPITDENLRQVAGLYRAAMERGDPPTQTVADAMGVPRSTAARWVAKARERDLLGPSLRGRPGEQQED